MGSLPGYMQEDVVRDGGACVIDKLNGIGMRTTSTEMVSTNIPRHLHHQTNRGTCNSRANHTEKKRVDLGQIFPFKSRNILPSLLSWPMGLSGQARGVPRTVGDSTQAWQVTSPTFGVLSARRAHPSGS